jgi:hypothetical protein
VNLITKSRPIKITLKSIFISVNFQFLAVVSIQDCLLVCDAVEFHGYLPIFRRKVLLHKVRFRKHISPKRRYLSNKLQGVMSLNAAALIFICLTRKTIKHSRYQEPFLLNIIEQNPT